MLLIQVIERAKRLGINSNNKGKTELIHEIQLMEHCSPCFGRKLNNPYCQNCCWVEDCFQDTNKGVSAAHIFEVF